MRRSCRTVGRQTPDPVLHLAKLKAAVHHESLLTRQTVQRNTSSLLRQRPLSRLALLPHRRTAATRTMSPPPSTMPQNALDLAAAFILGQLDLQRAASTAKHGESQLADGGRASPPLLVGLQGPQGSGASRSH